MGRSFLPRGTGIVTRRPLILQLIYCPLDDREHRSAEHGNFNLYMPIPRVLINSYTLTFLYLYFGLNPIFDYFRNSNTSRMGKVSTLQEQNFLRLRCHPSGD